MISEKATNLIHAVQRAYQFQNDTGVQAETDILDVWAPVFAYIAYLESDVEELKAYRNGYNTNEKTPEDEDVVLVELENVEGLLVGCYCQDGWLFQNVGGGFGSGFVGGFPVVNTNVIRWWPLPKGGGDD